MPTRDFLPAFVEKQSFFYWDPDGVIFGVQPQ